MLLLLRGSLSASHLHVCHTLGDTTNTRGRRGAVGGLLRAISGLLIEGWGAGLLKLLRSRVTGRRLLLLLLLVLTRICWSSIARSHGLSRAELASSWHLTAESGISTGADVECASSVCPFLLLATGI